MPYELSLPIMARRSLLNAVAERQLFATRNEALCAMIDAVSSGGVRIGVCGAQVSTSDDAATLDASAGNDQQLRFFFMPICEQRRMVLFVHQCDLSSNERSSAESRNSLPQSATPVMCACGSRRRVSTPLQQSAPCVGPLIMLDSGYVERRVERNDAPWLRKYRRLHWLSNLSRSRLQRAYRAAFSRRAPLWAQRESMISKIYWALEHETANESLQEPPHSTVFMRELDMRPSLHRFMIRDYICA